jgi:acetyl esterase/lipase
VNTAGAAGAVPADTGRVRVVRDLFYYDGEDRDPVRHGLDLYLPSGGKDFPVVMFVHGGVWMTGNKNFLGVYGALGRHLARHGLGVVIPNYRLSPAVKHPEHIKDVARAFAWAYKNIQDYGGRPDQLFVCGHSAGGHLVSLLATDESYLKAEGLKRSDVRGAVPISGVYSLEKLDFNLNLGLRLGGADRPMVQGEVDRHGTLLGKVFGNDPAVWKGASPLCHVGPHRPPFLIIYAKRDFPTCDRMSEQFCKKLKENRCQAATLVVEDRDHFSIIFQASGEGDPTSQAVLDFVQRHARK